MLREVVNYYTTVHTLVADVINITDFVEETILTPQMADGHYKISTIQLLYNVENKEPYRVSHSSISSCS